MTAREVLRSCRSAVREIQNIERQREMVKIPGEPVEKTTSVIKAESKTNNPKATALQNLEYYDALLAEKQEALVVKLLTLEDMLSALHNGTSRAVLRYYYGQAWTDERIAEELGIAQRTVYRKRNSAVMYLERNFCL